MISKEEKLGLAAYVITSSYRERALTVLHNNENMTPKYIAKHCNVRGNHISTTLRELKDKQLVVCINEEAHKGRLYQITSLGEEVISLIPGLKGKTRTELNDLGGEMK
ncbi:transcriptional regulator [uncultured Methanobrevibacter sp.]|uniref:transcriptional regulator n=1 Tax=uncultured Methanobrevibacter sp. TaxID=253161 RepID=UPI0025D68B8E|nr:transcriptional regulator [uncultured Methanobrevibacter sp.]